MTIMQLGYWVPHRSRAGRARGDDQAYRRNDQQESENLEIAPYVSWERKHGKRSKNDFSNGKRSQTTSMFHLHFAISSPMCMYACAHVQAPLWQISKRFFEVLWGTNNNNMLCADGVPRTWRHFSSYTAYDAVLRYGCTVLRDYWYRTLFTCYLLWLTHKYSQTKEYWHSRRRRGSSFCWNNRLC